MSKALTGAMALIAGRTKQRAEDQTEEDMIDGEEEDVTEGEPDGDETDESASGDETDDAAEDGTDEYVEGEEEENASDRAAYRRGGHAMLARANTIMSHPAGASVPTLAANLAFNQTAISTKKAIGMLTAASGDMPKTKAAGGSLAAQMAAHKNGVAPNKPKSTTGSSANDEASRITAVATALAASKRSNK